MKSVDVLATTVERKMAHSLGVRKTVSVLSHKLSKPHDIHINLNYSPQANVE